MSLLTTVIAAVLASGPGSVANVDDPLSHGTVGDSKLSLDEAIRVANGSLSLASLSPAEQARILGTGTVQTIVVDAATTPVITVQSPLTDVFGPGMAVGRLTIEGHANNGVKPVLAGGTQTHVFSMQRHLITIMGFRFETGGIAVDAKMPMMPMPMMGMAMVSFCEFDGQTSAAVQTRATGTDETMLMVRDSVFTNMPLAFRFDDQSNGGRIMNENERCTMDGVVKGCEAFSSGFGNVSMWALWRSSFVNGDTLATSTRAPTSTQLLMLRIVYTDAICSGDVIDCNGGPNGVTMIHHHHGDWTCGANSKALWTHPRTAQFDVHGSEMVFNGDIWLSGNTTSPRMWHQNNHYQNGTITYDVDGALPNLVWNRYDNCSIAVTAAARSPVTIRASQLSNTDINSLSFLAPISVRDSRRSGGTLTGFSSETNAAPAPFLGTTTVTPKEPQVGTSLQFSADVPFGVGLVWDVVESYARPNTSSEPIRIYGDPVTAIILPAVMLFQSTMTVPTPNAPALIGLEFYVQGISVPVLSLPFVPAFQLPRGERITFTL